VRPEKDYLKNCSLIVVGTGIRVVGQLTMEAIAWIKRADRVLYVVADPVSIETIHELNPLGAESLLSLYADGKPRLATYDAMVERILTCVREGKLTCVASYGHPGVLAFPSHEAIRRVRAEGYVARMLPGISAADCLFADLGIDPATHGCQSYDATDFLLHCRTIDTSASVVLWQVGVVGDPMYREAGYDRSALPMLVARLCQFYPPDHGCYIYQAAVYPGFEPRIRAAPISDLPQLEIGAMSLLYIPPARAAIPDSVFANQLNSMLAGGERAGRR
jgi:uncharacterized protein YabN with tetrapyrrole methylase and pyrophosphatase domain